MSPRERVPAIQIHDAWVSLDSGTCEFAPFEIFIVASERGRRTTVGRVIVDTKK